MKTSISFATFCARLCLALCLFALGSQPALAFDDPPTRVARLNYMSGEVSFQPGGETDWAWATLNRPMTSGDSLWTGDQSRAEMHIGSAAIRVGAQTSVSFLNLDDRTVQLQLNTGTINVRVRNLFADNVFEVDTPNLAFTLLRRGDYRITVDPNGSFTTITLRDGQGQINGGGQAFLVDGGSQVQVSGTDYISYDIYNLPRKDSFDQWSYTRQLREDRSRSARYVSPELTGSEDLDQNGTWRTDRDLGPVWVPTHVSRDWAPYRDGHWSWVDPWGWTWVDDAPSGFVTSHYGRWAHTNGGYGGGGWVWVPPHREARRDESEQRPVYSPALVTFVGDSNSSRDFGNRGGVAWFPLAPGEVYVPAYQTSPKYVTNVNITNTVVQQTTITNVTNNVTNNNTQNTIYVNQKVAGAVTAVPRDTFVNARPVAQAAVKIAPNAIPAGPAVRTAPVAPERASIMGANRGRPGNAAAAASAPPTPPAAVVARPVVAKVAPPPPPVAFAQKQQALQANQGKPLDAKAEQNLRAATPPPASRFVKTAPPAAAVKPVETAPKKAQPATSLNTAQQVHPPAPGAPPVAAGSPQNAQQQLAAEKAKQQAAQQQAQQAAADKAKQEAAQQQAAQQAAAEKAKQDAAQQHATQQQAAADKAKQEAAQQQAAAEKAKQEAAQKQAAQQAATEKAKQDAAQQHMTQQQAAAEKSKQEAAQQQAAQQAASEKAKQEAAQQHATQQQAAAEKSKQEAAQQQAAQQAASEKAKQEAAQQHAAQQQAAAEKAKQEAAQQQAAQQAATEKAKQEAAQQHAAQQQAAADKAKQEAAQQAAAEKAKQQASQQQAAQLAAVEKAKQEAAQQHAAQQQAAQQAAAEKSRQQAAQQLAVAEKTRQDAAQRQAAQQPQATRPGPPSTVHPNETPAPPRAVVPPSANAELDRKHQQEQDQLRAKQEQDRLRVQQQQEQEHAKLAQQQTGAAQKQVVEQQHQAQTQQLLQKHADEQKALADKQKQERQNQAKPQKGDRPPQ